MSNSEKEDNEISELRKNMSFPENDLDNIDIEDANVEYIDKDNYDKFLKIKSKNGFVFQIIQSYGKELYFTMVILMGILYYFNIMKEHFQVFEQITRFLPDPNVYLLLIPLFITVIYKSFNSFSEIKISI
jgi:hypothetical protein|tara:strand:+ start:144 stop:533 length:390 start_codon:yes stop_codon:yes gene_type:complete